MYDPYMATITKRDPLTGRNIASDHTGKRFGKLTILHPTEKRCPNGYVIWRVQCDCGKEVNYPAYRFTNRRSPTRTCGCGPKGRRPIPNNGSHFNMAFTKAKQSARDRGLYFALPHDVFCAMITKPCFYCGTPPEMKRAKNLSGTVSRHGIDRISSSKGYTLDNCVPCCAQCNVAKLAQSVDEFKAWIKRAYLHLFC